LHGLDEHISAGTLAAAEAVAPLVGHIYPIRCAFLECNIEVALLSVADRIGSRRQFEGIIVQIVICDVNSSFFWVLVELDCHVKSDR